jgi:hypothetical protein
MVICRDTPNKILIIIFFLFCVSHANAEVYKWVDENGKIVYGDKPISSDASKIKIKKAPVQDPVVQQRNEKQNKLLDVIQEEREQRDASRKEEKKKNDELKKMCADARKELQKMKNASFLYEKTDDPDNPKIMTDEERKAEEIRFEKEIKKNC